jgi:glutamate synthase domain-containing protein 3
MSGGIAYVYDKDGDFKNKCNMEMVTLEPLTKSDKKTIVQLLGNHKKYTGSSLAQSILDNLHKELRKFVKVMPLEYKRLLETVKEERVLDLLEVSDG